MATFLSTSRLSMRTMATILAATVLVYGAAQAHAKAAPVRPDGVPAKAIPLFVNGTDGVSCYRIPAIVRTPDGTLLAFAEAHVHNCNDFGEVRIVMRRSLDGGRTWSEIETVASNGNLQAGNASPVVDTLDPHHPRGRVFLIYCTGNAPEEDVFMGKGVRRVWYRTSEDDGRTWDAPVEITSSVKLPNWRAYATGPGHALLITSGSHKGRLLVSANHSTPAPRWNGRSYEANSFYSDNHGRTWHLGATVAWPGSNESTSAEVNGTVVINSRDEGGSHARVISISHDGGAHWSTTFLAKDLPDPICEGSMVSDRLSSGQTVLLFSNAGNTSARKDLTISVSWDGGRTWPKHTILDPGPSAYSDIVVLPHQRLGILWEPGAANGIYFLAHKISTLL